MEVTPIHWTHNNAPSSSHDQILVLMQITKHLKRIAIPILSAEDDDRCFEFSKCLFSFCGKNFVDGALGRFLDQTIRIHEEIAQTLGQDRSDGRLTTETRVAPLTLQRISTHEGHTCPSCLRDTRSFRPVLQPPRLPRPISRISLRKRREMCCTW